MSTDAQLTIDGVALPAAGPQGLVVAAEVITLPEWRAVLPNRSYMRVCPATG